MRNVFQFDGIVFWVNQDIIHCKLDSQFFTKYNSETTVALLKDTIPSLSHGSYLPLLINVENLERPCALKLFNIISNSSDIKKLVLSRIFVVNSFGLKIILTLNNLIVKQAVPNKIFRNYNSAITFCKNDYLSFNRVTNHNFS
ncbi:hypothetical protein [uncultured Winogradskyella sp.]|uniref:hypothetical protein n=1 Tax=Winogradskyella sp. 4-2091 TaxID=3381659 RepID=UPI0026051BDC|nr:hypothetical protein [uncultured Winogradskyella sp.]